MKYKVIATTIQSNNFDETIIIETKGQDFNLLFEHSEYIALKARVKVRSGGDVVVFAAEYKKKES